jgi:hypothetical protein
VVPIRLDTERKTERFGVSRNVSASGMLLRTRSRFNIGDRIGLTFRFASDSSDRRLDGEVVRLERDHADTSGIFPRHVAVKFDKRHVDIEPMLVEASTRQRDAFGLSFN